MTSRYRVHSSPLFDVRVVDDPSAAVAAVADEIVRLVRDASRRPSDGESFVLGLATGATMVPVYQTLVERHERGSLRFGRVRGVLLDEYRGLPPGHPERFVRWIEERLARRVDLPLEQLEAPPADAEGRDLENACAAFERRLRELGGVDLQLLGLGRNGHVAFNEPGSPADSHTRLVRLAESSREANATSFGSLEATPTFAVTQGLATIRAARRLRLLAFGAGKRDALQQLLALTDFDPRAPASALAGHQDLVIWTDRAALG
jgi:glucosamine-6-phosphate deaminase